MVSSSIVMVLAILGRSTDMKQQSKTVHAFVPPLAVVRSTHSSSSSFTTSTPSFATSCSTNGRSQPFAFKTTSFNKHPTSSLLHLSSSISDDGSTSIEYPPASDGEALHYLFANHCDGEGLMTEEMLRGVPAVRDMLEQGDLLPTELTDIWSAAPKFPQEGTLDKIDVDSFIQVYRDIDDLFEEDDAGDDAFKEDKGAVVAATSSDDNDDNDDQLKATFSTLAGSGDDSMLSFTQLRQWEEVKSLIEEEGMLGEDEFITLWEKSVGGTKGERGAAMDVEAFVAFNDALDELFVFDDDELDEDTYDEEDTAILVEEEEKSTPAPPRPVITDEDIPPGVLFSQLANENYLVGPQELQRWGELNDMMTEGDLTVEELQGLLNGVPKAPGTKDMLDKDGFMALYDAIDALFEDDDGEDGDAAESSTTTTTSQASESELKEELLELLEDLAKLAEQEGRQPCGLDCTELEQERVLEVVGELEREPYNQVGGEGDKVISKEQLSGVWDLLYSSSSTMKYNEGLSGLAGGLTKFGGVQQRLTSTKFLSDVEYTEQVIGKVGGKSFEVKITGDWDLRTEISLFTGKPSNVMSVTPDKVAYGPRSDKADHWKSLGPMNLLVLAYLDDDLRVMRGNTSTDTLFILRRSE